MTEHGERCKLPLVPERVASRCDDLAEAYDARTYLGGAFARAACAIRKAAAEIERLRLLAQWGEPRLARHQPCGCVICVCDDTGQCYGCVAKHCGTHAVGEIPNPVWESHPLLSEIERLRHEVAVRDRALCNLAEEHCCPDRDEIAYAGETHESYRDYFVVQPAIAQARAEMEAEQNAEH